jgi:hypothetical protein
MKVKIIACLFLFIHAIEAKIPVFRPLSKDVSNMLVVDSGSIRVWYALNAADIKKIETYDDLQRLEIGLQISKYFSHFVFNSDSLCTDWVKKHKGAQSIPRWMGIRGKNSNWSEYSMVRYKTL